MTISHLEELVNQHARLLYENSKAVSDEDESREEYQCLHIIKLLTKQHIHSADCDAPFKLFLDDRRFGNIIVDPKTFEIKELIDWEFSYSAPRQFLISPPPWLIPNPDPWDWSSKERSAFKSCFSTFLRSLQEEEAMLERGHGFSSQMQNHFEDGKITFWYKQVLREPLCCVELMKNWSSELGRPMETPVDMEEFVKQRFEVYAVQS